MSAEEYARRFAQHARERREATERRFKCCVCNRHDVELFEHGGRFYCSAHDPTALPARGGTTE